MDNIKSKIKYFIIAFVIILFFYLVFNIPNIFKKKEQEKEIELGLLKNTIVVNGNYVEYLNVNDLYQELGATVYDEDGKITNEKINISYFQDTRQVFNIDPRFTGSYIVQYKASINGKAVEASRVVIISDIVGPTIEEIPTVTISEVEAKTYNTKEGVVALDKSNRVAVECDNTLKDKVGTYIITCTAKDDDGNISTKKRIIKVIKGIQFNEKSTGLIINYPSGEFEYKYSLDGGNTFYDADKIQIIKNQHNNVIASVYKEGKLVMSHTYLKK